MADRYWRGGSGTWNSTDTTHWSTSSGGAGGASVPTSADDVYFDSSSGAGNYTCTVDATASPFYLPAKNISLANPAGGVLTMTSSSLYGLYVSGNLTAAASVSLTNNLCFAFVATSGTKTITSNGVVFPQSLNFSNTGAVYQFADDITATYIGLYDGELDFNDKNVTISSFYSEDTTSARILRMGSGTITVSSSWKVKYTNFTLYSETSTLTFDITSSSTVTCQSSYSSYSTGILYYNNVIVKGSGTGLMYFSYDNYFANLTVDRSSANKTIKISKYSWIILSGTFTCATSGTNTLTLNSYEAGRVVYISKSAGAILVDYLIAKDITAQPSTVTWYCGDHSTDSGNNSGLIFTALPPTVTTQACSAVDKTSVTGNGNITALNGGSCTRRGFCYKVGTSGDPTTADSTAYDDGTYSTGAYTKSITGLSGNTTYRVRAYAINSGGTGYGTTVSVTTVKEDFTDPTNAYADDGNYATTSGADGTISVSLSKDAGVNYNSELTKTFTGVESTETFGSGSTELWGTAWTGDDVDDTSFRLKIRCGGSTTTYQIYKTFGFAITASYILTGIEVAVKAKWDGATTSINHIKIKIYYGTSTLPVQAGSQAYASDGRKAGEGAGAGTGVLVFYDGSNWIACDTGATVAA